MRRARPDQLSKTTREEDSEAKPDNAVVISCKRRLRDYAMLAHACKRAGKVRDEGRAYFSMGVLHDNMQNYRLAVAFYEKFLRVCQEIGDSHGEALAYNCVGVNYQMLAQPTRSKEMLEQAISYHQRHEELADVNGKFLASINLGLCYDLLDDNKNSVYHFQNGLKYAVKMSSVVGQSIAIGNIGRIGTAGLHDNRDKMKLFLEKYIQLSKDLKDGHSETEACLKLGLLTGSKRSYEEGRVNFEKALEMAEKEGQGGKYNQAKCGLAVVNAELAMRKRLKDLSFSLHE